MNLIPSEVRQGISSNQWPTGTRAVGLSGADDDDSVYAGVRGMFTSTLDGSLPPLYMKVSLNNSIAGNEFHHAYDRVKLSRILPSEPLEMPMPSDPRTADFELSGLIVGFFHIPLKGFFRYLFDRSSVNYYQFVNLTDESLVVTFGGVSQFLESNSPAAVPVPKGSANPIPASDSSPNLGYLTSPWRGAFKSIEVVNGDGDVQMRTRFFVEPGNIPIVAFYKNPPSDVLELAVLSSVYSVASTNRYRSGLAFLDYFEPWLESEIDV